MSLLKHKIITMFSLSIYKKPRVKKITLYFHSFDSCLKSACRYENEITTTCKKYFNIHVAYFVFVV